jgi:hypothetical protein
MISMNMVFGLGALAGSFGLLVLGYRWWWRRLKRRQVISTAATDASDFAIEDLERSIGGKLPVILRNAYLDGSITRLLLPITFQWESTEYAIVGFILADARANERLATSTRITGGAFVFAEDDFGNYYFVKGNDNAVYFWDHELGGDITKILGSIEDLWKVLYTR